MAKFAVVLFAVIAAASAAALLPYGYQGSTWGGYGGGLYGYPTGQHLLTHYTEKYGQQIYETPIELVKQIQFVATDLTGIFENGMYFTEQHAHLLSTYARHFAYIIKNVVDKLESYEHVDAVIQQVIYKLREVYIHFEELADYTVYTNVHHYRTEFDNYIQIAVAQIEKLVVIAQEQHYGNFYYTIKGVLHFFLYGLFDIQHQLQQVVGYGAHYGVGYGYGHYSQGYGYPYGHQYGSGYGYGKLGLQYGLGLGYGPYAGGYGYGYQHLPSWGSSLYNYAY